MNIFFVAKQSIQRRILVLRYSVSQNHRCNHMEQTLQPYRALYSFIFYRVYPSPLLLPAPLRFSDHGLPFICNASHPWQKGPDKATTCGYPRLNILFAPKISCPNPQFVYEEDRDAVVACTVYANPEGKLTYAIQHNINKKRKTN